jgi:hypothetical protein
MFCYGIIVSSKEVDCSLLQTTSDSVWNPFPRIADFTSSVKSEHDDETEGDLVKLNESDPFDIFHIGVVSSRLGLSTHGSGLSFDSVTELSDLDKTIHDPMFCYGIIVSSKEVDCSLLQTTSFVKH